jgi:hypothetical protein
MDFKGDKNPKHAFLWRGNKAVGSMLQDFKACQRILRRMKGILSKAKFVTFFYKVPLAFLPHDSTGRIARLPGVFLRLFHFTMVLYAHTSPGG